MGLITCPKCKNKYSEHLSSCPKCGSTKEVAVTAYKNDDSRKSVECLDFRCNKTKCMMVSIISLIAGISFGLLITWIIFDKHQGKDSNELALLVRNSIGNDFENTIQSLNNRGLIFNKIDGTGMSEYSHNDTSVVLTPASDNGRVVAGIYLSIKFTSAKNAIEKYKYLREYCARTYPTYICTIIKDGNYIVESKDPITVDTISPMYLESHRISFNEKWTNEGNYQNRNSIALVSHVADNTWKVNLIFRTDKSCDF